MAKQPPGNGRGESDVEYEVGYGKPPIKHRFKKGQSGNPHGRPRPPANLYKQVAEELHSMITINENGQQFRTTRSRAFAKRLVNQALQGSARHQKIILDMISRIEQEFASDPSKSSEGFQEFVAALNELAARRAPKKGDG